MLASSSIDNASGSSLNGGVLGVDLAGASARPDGTGRTEVLPSSSIDNASESSSVVLDSAFEDAEDGRAHGAAVVLAGAFAGPDGTGAGVAGAVIHRQQQKKRNRTTSRSKKKRGSKSRTKANYPRDERG